MPKPSVLWIDGVGSYALCEKDSVTIGQSFPGNDVDLAIRGDLSRRACAIHRVGGDYWIEAYQSVRVSDGVLEKPVMLRDQSICVLGERVKFQYFRPSPLSSTVRLTLVSEHRWQPFVDSVILVAESVVIGCDPTCHIRYSMPAKVSGGGIPAPKRSHWGSFCCFARTSSGFVGWLVGSRFGTERSRRDRFSKFNPANVSKQSTCLGRWESDSALRNLPLIFTVFERKVTRHFPWFQDNWSYSFLGRTT